MRKDLMYIENFVKEHLERKEKQLQEKVGYVKNILVEREGFKNPINVDFEVTYMRELRAEINVLQHIYDVINFRTEKYKDEVVE